MQFREPAPGRNIRVRGTEILATDTPQQYREKLARIAMDEMCQFVAVLDAQGRLLEVNRAALEGAGLELLDVEHKPFWECFWWTLSDEIQQELKAAIERASRGEFVRYDVEIYGRAHGRETIIIDFSMTPVTDEAGRVVFIVTEGRNITEKKAQERERAQNTAELQALLERIRELDEIKTQYFVNVSHELRTPLALILGPAQRLLDKHTTLAADERYEAAGVIVRNARMLLKHVNDLLELSKLEAGKLDLGPADTTAFRITLPNHRLHPAQDITAEPKLDRGLVSGITEELRPSSTPRPAGEPDRPARRAVRETVLVVEDNIDMNRFVSQCLGEYYEVASAFDGRAGLERALALRPALIVSEIMMPVMSGADMIAELRKRPELDGMPIVVLSAKADEELKVKLLEDGTQDFITKPFTEKDLLIRVRNLIDVRRSRERERQETAVNEALYRVAASFADELDQEKLLQLVTDEATTLTGAEFGAFFFNATDVDGGKYLLYTLSGAPPEAFASFPMPRATLLFGPTFRGEGGIRLDDVRVDPRYGRMGPQPAGHLPVVSYLAVPVIGRGGEVFGGLFFGHGQPARFTEVHERIARGLAAQAAAALAKARLYEALRASEARAREADQRKDEFLAMLGHELRNPLAPIMTALDLMTMRGDERTTKEQQVIERQVKHLSRLVDDLLDIARVTRGKIQIHKQRINLASLVERAVEMASPLFEQRAHRLHVAVPRTGLELDADPARLAQVVSNLLTNAAKYTDPGGSIELTAEARGDRIAISVKDNGQGISPELLPHIFELFVQDKRSSERAQGGLGIGLALVRNLVELHGGRVEARSEGPGHGSEFVIELPAASGAIEHITATAASSPRAHLGSRILLVDDNVDAVNMLAEALAMLGHEVRVAHDGAQALAIAESFHPATAVLDLGLPVMDGYELSRMLRERWRDPSVRFVAITGYGQESDKEKTKAAGFDAHLVKPIKLAELAAVVQVRDGSPEK